MNRGRIAGHELVPNRPLIKDFDANRGTHVVHAGGDHPSYLLVPILPDLQVSPG